MKPLVASFQSVPWEEPAPGLRVKKIEHGTRRARLMEFTPAFVEEDWCTTGHAGQVLEGEIEIDFGGTPVRVKAGQVLLIPPGDDSKHKARAITNVVRLFLVEDV